MHYFSAFFSSVFASLLCVVTAYTPIAVKNVTPLGPQLSPDVTNVSRDGGYSVLVNGNVIWLYDDTECMDLEGTQLSFVSNTAASQPQANNVTVVNDFGVVNVGKEKDGSEKNAIFAHDTVGTGGWIPFQPDELDFNQQQSGKERVAICESSLLASHTLSPNAQAGPGTSPTPISIEEAFIYAPLVYVDMKPQDPSKEYAGRGMTLFTITAPATGPKATRQGDLVIPGTEIGFGGFSTLLGRKSSDSASDNDSGNRDIYLLGVANSGLQLARVGVNDLNVFSQYNFWQPDKLNFSTSPPKKGLIDNKQIYMPGTFSCGDVFYSPFFETFVMVYFNKMADSTFYIRYLDLHSPVSDDSTWKAGGRKGKGIEAEDVESLVRYSWSSEQKLYASKPGPGGFNYAGTPHPEFFNSQYFAKSLYPDGTSNDKRANDWYGESVVSRADSEGKDGKYLLLSWTSQKVGGLNAGIYGVELAVLEFDDIPKDPDAPTKTVSPSSSAASSTTTAKASHVQDTHDAIESIFHRIKTGSAGTLSSYVWWYLPTLGLLILLAATFHFRLM